MIIGNIENGKNRYLKGPKWTSDYFKFLYKVWVSKVGHGCASAVIPFATCRFGPNVASFVIYHNGTYMGIKYSFNTAVFCIICRKD